MDPSSSSSSPAHALWQQYTRWFFCFICLALPSASPWRLSKKKNPHRKKKKIRPTDLNTLMIKESKEVLCCFYEKIQICCIIWQRHLSDITELHSQAASAHENQLQRSRQAAHRCINHLKVTCFDPFRDGYRFYPPSVSSSEMHYSGILCLKHEICF